MGSGNGLLNFNSTLVMPYQDVTYVPLRRFRLGSSRKGT